jgi:hypothetical protein
MHFLPKDHRGYVVPFFVAWIDGKPDFRVVDPAKKQRCVSEGLCWLCGGPLQRFVAYVIGPMCALNRISSEPPSHRECAEYACRVCPFLTMPKAQRREVAAAVRTVAPAGEMIARNPGVALLWITRDRLKPVRAPNGVLFDVGEPAQVFWFAEGRAATRDEIIASIESGLPVLRAPAEQEGARLSPSSKPVTRAR